MRSASSEASSASQCSRRCFAHVSGYRTPEAFVHGTTTAVYIGGALVAVGAVAAALIKPRPAVVVEVSDVALQAAT